MDLPYRKVIKAHQCSHDMNQTHATKNLLDISNVLDQYGIAHWLAFGTSLGAYRDNQFIPYDKDIDIGFFYEDIDKVVEIIEQEYVPKFGFMFLRHKKDVISISRDMIYIDFMFFWSESDNNYRCHTFTIPHDQIDNGFSTVDFCGKQFNMVKDPVRYFRRLYGDSWTTPIKNRQANG
jgi:phosphorylcholine metabolism protein LicD